MEPPEWVVSKLRVVSTVVGIYCPRCGQSFSLFAQSCVRIKFTCQEIIQNELNDERINYKKVSALVGNEKVETVVTLLHWILRQACQYNAPLEILTLELEQLGLPSETAYVIVNSYRKVMDRLKTHFAKQTFQV